MNSRDEKIQVVKQILYYETIVESKDVTPNRFDYLYDLPLKELKELWKKLQ